MGAWCGTDHGHGVYYGEITAMIASMVLYYTLYSILRGIYSVVSLLMLAGAYF